MTVLVTGAAGFLGSAILDHLSRQGVPTVGWDVREVAGCQIEGVDILCVNGLAARLHGVDCVIHAAGIAHLGRSTGGTRARLMAVNAEGAGRMAEAAAEAGVRRFVLLSSVSVYGSRRAGLIGEDALLQPEGAYAESKRDGELRVAEVAARSGMRLSTLRLATAYGEGDPGSVASMIRAIAGRRFVWLGRGTNRKSLIHREDAARACVRAALFPVGITGTFNVVGSRHSMREIVDAVSTLLGVGTPRWVIPVAPVLAATWVLRGLSVGRGSVGALYPMVRRWASNDEYSGERFEAVFGFTPRVELHEGLRRECAWLGLGQTA